jgi:hypothetical protein
MSNPFFVGGPVPADRLVGRQRELNTVFDQIGNRGHVALYGSSGVGKSSFLQALVDPQSWTDRQRDHAGAVIVYLDCAGLKPFAPGKFWRRLLELIHNSPSAGPAVKALIDVCLKEAIVGHAHMRKVTEAVQKHKRLVILLDDYDAAVTANPSYSETEMLTHLFEFRTLLVEKLFSVVVATSRRLTEMGPRPTVLPEGSPWYNQYLICPLPLFRKKEIAELFARLGQHTGAVEDGIRELAGGHPALLQHGCRMLYDAWHDGDTLNAENFSRTFEQNTREYFRNAWLACTPQEQMLLTLIALSRLAGRVNTHRRYDLGDLDVVFSQRDRELRDLEERGLIQREAQTETYAFTSSIMEWWVVKEIENSNDEAELAEREKVVFSAVTRKQVEKITNVMKQAWAHKDAIKSVVGYAGKLVGAFAKGAGTG